MCQLINDVINDFVNNNKMFTAHNVTAEVRRRTTDRITHDEVKRAVHGMFNTGQMSGYNRNLASLPNANPQPWVYHPMMADSTLYTGQPTDHVDSLPADPVDPYAAPAHNVAVPATDAYVLDTTNRLCVPAKLIRAAGMCAGQTVCVLAAIADDKLVLTNDADGARMLSNGWTLITNYVVDNYDNIRITLATLQKGNMNGREYQIEGDGNSITVREY